MAQGNAQVLQRALLDHVAHGQVTFPLTFVASGSTDVGVAFVHAQETQAGNPDFRKVIAMANLPSGFPGALNLPIIDSVMK